MGRGWAVGASAALAVAVTMGALQTAPRDLDAPISVLLAIATLLAYAAWAYAIAVGAYGSKGALVALVGYALWAMGAWGIAPLLDAAAHARLVIALSAIALLAGAGAIFGLVREIRARRGPIQWGTALFFLAPLVLFVLVTMAARSLSAA